MTLKGFFRPLFFVFFEKPYTQSYSMLNESKGIDSFNAYQCIRDYLDDLSIKELVKVVKDYGIEVS